MSGEEAGWSLVGAEAKGELVRVSLRLTEDSADSEQREGKNFEPERWNAG